MYPKEMKVGTDIIGDRIICHMVCHKLIGFHFSWRRFEEMPLITGMSDIYATDIANVVEEKEYLYD